MLQSGKMQVAPDPPHCSLLIVQFKSFRRHFIILARIPLSLIGAVAGLLIDQVNFSNTCMLDLFSLAAFIIGSGNAGWRRIADRSNLG